MGRSKQVRRYSECQHDADPKYVYCGSEDHEDNDEENEACYQAQSTGRRNRSTTITVIDEKYCSKACEAEFGIWICCECKQSVIGPMERNADNDLFHYYVPEGSDEPVEHIFCPTCTVPSGRED